MNMNKRNFLKSIFVLPFTGKPLLNILGNINLNQPPCYTLNITSIPIIAKTTKLKAVWSEELLQDLKAYHNIDAEKEIEALLKYESSKNNII